MSKWILKIINRSIQVQTYSRFVGYLRSHHLRQLQHLLGSACNLSPIVSDSFPSPLSLETGAWPCGVYQCQRGGRVKKCFAQIIISAVPCSLFPFNSHLPTPLRLYAPAQTAWNAAYIFYDYDYVAECLCCFHFLPGSPSLTTPLASMTLQLFCASVYFLQPLFAVNGNALLFFCAYANL